MKVLAKLALILLVLMTGLFAFPALADWWRARSATMYRTARVQVIPNLVSVVNATGTVTPVVSVRVGSFASGPVLKLHVDYRSEVKKDGLLAEIDPTLHEAIRDRDAAALALAQADVQRVRALLEQATYDMERGRTLYGRGAMPQEEWDRVRAARASLAAQLRVAEAQVLQAEAGLRNSDKNLSFTKIRSPVDGVVIDRKIDEGQTLVTQFMVPDLFVVAQDLRKAIHVYASVDESDVAQITRAQERGQRVHFTVDAHPDELFEGKIHQIRLNATLRENVVTYTVVVSSPNPDLKLLPGMTAKLSFEIEQRTNVLVVPNAALRFYPKSEQVQEIHRKILELAEEAENLASDDKSLDTRSASQRVLDHRQTHRRHVWKVGADGLLTAVEVYTGISDFHYTEILSDPRHPGFSLPLEVGEELVLGGKK